MIEEIEYRKLIQKVTFDSSTWFGTDYNMNLYRGCCHGCIYCDSRSNCYHIEDFDRVRVKASIPLHLNMELKGKRSKGVIGIGAMSDTYNPYEKQLLVTRAALEQISSFEFGVAIDTKSDLVTRDIDYLKKITEGHSAIVKLTITTSDDSLCQVIEPNAPLSSRRFEAVRALSEAGIFCGILFTPLLPFLTDTEENIMNMVQKAHDCGAKFIYCNFGVTLRENQRDYYYKKLDQNFPGLTDQYIKTYRNSYVCNSIHHKKLFILFQNECNRLGLLYQMKDIIAAYQKKEPFEQLSLF